MTDKARDAAAGNYADEIRFDLFLRAEENFKAGWDACAEQFDNDVGEKLLATLYALPLRAENEALRAALEFYANGWVRKPNKIIKVGLGTKYIEEVWKNPIVQADGGEVARLALEKE